MFRKIYEVLFRNERMCATRFSTSGIAFLRMTDISYKFHDVFMTQFLCRSVFYRTLNATWSKIWFSWSINEGVDRG